MDSEKRSWTVDIDPRVNATSSTANPKRKNGMVYVAQGDDASTINTGVKNWMAYIQSRAAEHSISSEEELWKNASIFKLPALGRNLNPKAFTPTLVSLGPYHCDNNELRPFMMHKERALIHFVRRAGKPFDELVKAVKSVLQELQDSYNRLDEKWRADKDGFLKLMIVDGCFMLEVLYFVVYPERDYSPFDPIFSKRGILHEMPKIRRDMLLIENQLPLLLLKTLFSFRSPDIFKEMERTNSHIHHLVLNFLNERVASVGWINFLSYQICSVDRNSGLSLRDHALDAFRHMFLRFPQSNKQMEPTQSPKQHTGAISCARELHECGVRFKRSGTRSFIKFNSRKGVLSLPELVVDDATECILLNLVAYEHFHFNTNHDVTSYVCFMGKIINTADDVSLLQAKGIIQNYLGSDENVAQLFNRISKGVTDDLESPLAKVREQLRVYCHKRWNSWRANLVQKYCRRLWNSWKVNVARIYFRNPWSTLSFAGAVLAIALTAVQTGLAIYQSYKPAKNG